MRRFHSVDQAQQLARRRVPPSVYRFLEGGTDAEVTVAANRAASRESGCPSASGVVHPEPDLRTEVLGQQLEMPLRPRAGGYIRLAHRDGEAGAARARGTCGSSHRREHPREPRRVRHHGHRSSTWSRCTSPAAVRGPRYGRRSGAWAGCRALIVTLDLAASAARERMLKGGAIPTSVTLAKRARYAPSSSAGSRRSATSSATGCASTSPTCGAIRTGPR